MDNVTISHTTGPTQNHIFNGWRCFNCGAIIYSHQVHYCPNEPKPWDTQPWRLPYEPYKPVAPNPYPWRIYPIGDDGTTMEIILDSIEDEETEVKANPWVCPRCDKVNAPHMDQCKCSSSSNDNEVSCRKDVEDSP